MLILSIDVGIRNLAVCFVDRKTQLDQTYILYWDVLDVLKDNNPTRHPMCSSQTKLLKPCKHRGLYTDGVDKYRCNRHKTPDMTKYRRPKPLNSKTCTEQILAIKTIDILRNFIKQFPISPDVVRIEQQPWKSRKLILQSHVIFGFLVVEYPSSTVIFVSPHNKFHFKLDNKRAAVPVRNKRTRYQIRKNNAIAQVDFALNEYPNLIEKLDICVFRVDTYHKKDDLADSLLQALH